MTQHVPLADIKLQHMHMHDVNHTIVSLYVIQCRLGALEHGIPTLQNQYIL